MPDPTSPVRRIARRSAAAALLLVLVAAAAARGAEVDAAELDGMLRRDRVEVAQGSTSPFVLSVRASGDIRCTATPENPATAIYETLYTINEDGSITQSDPSDPLPFYAGANGGSTCQVTWPGDPAWQTVQMRVRAHRDAPLGEYLVLLRPTLSTPPGSGDRLEDRTRTRLTFVVGPGSDTTPPTVACAAPSGTAGQNGWYVSAVTVSCTASDDGSGLADPADAAFTLTTDDEGTVWTAQRVVADNAGNETVVGPFGPFNVDLNDPWVTIGTPADGGEYVLGSEVVASFTCADSASGIATCASDGSLLDTASIGTKTFTVHAADVAGRPTSVTHTYHVVYDFSGTTTSGSGSSVRRAGAARPVSWTLNGVSTLSSFVAASTVPCEGGTSEPARTPGRSGVSYDPGTDRFHMVWQTEATWSGTCRTLLVHLADGTTHVVDRATLR